MNKLNLGQAGVLFLAAPPCLLEIPYSHQLRNTYD
jgi:hypothetical protein